MMQIVKTFETFDNETLEMIKKGKISSIHINTNYKYVLKFLKNPIIFYKKPEKDSWYNMNDEQFTEQYAIYSNHGPIQERITCHFSCNKMYIYIKYNGEEYHLKYSDIKNNNFSRFWICDCNIRYN